MYPTLIYLHYWVNNLVFTQHQSIDRKYSTNVGRKMGRLFVILFISCYEPRNYAQMGIIINS